MSTQCNHISLNTNNWKKLLDFYCNVFDAKFIPPEKHIYGAWFDKASGMKGADIKGCKVAFPNGQELEILEHTKKVEWPKDFNTSGFGHLGFMVDNVDETCRKLLEGEGRLEGEVVSRYYENMDKTLRFVYARDPEGNLVEVMKWTSGKSEDAI